LMLLKSFSKIVFMDVSKDVEEKAKEYIDKYFSYTYMLLGLVPDEVFTAIMLMLLNVWV